MWFIHQSSRWGWVLFLVALLAYAGWQYQEEQRLNWELDREQVLMEHRLSRMVAANRALKEQIGIITSEACFKAVRAEVEKNVCDLRGLPLLEPVRYQRMPRIQLREYMLSKLGSQYTTEEICDYEKALKRIGLLPWGMDLASTITELYSEQVAAFYDPDSHALFTFEELSLKNNFERIILAHELVHVLQDQHFNLLTLPLKAKDGDDASLAAAALVEGDASRVMESYLRKHFNAMEIFEDLGLLFAQKTDKLFSAPPFLRDALLFPYQDGKAFVTVLHDTGGQVLVDQAYLRPPLSTEQILHPAKYLSATPDIPKAVCISIVAKPSWRKAHENTVGELGIRSLFAPSLGIEKAEKAAAGWGGDRYVVYDVGKNRWVLAWKSTWDSVQDARQFFDALEDFYRNRYQSGHATRSPSRGANVAAAESIFFSVASQKQNILIEKDTVLLLDAPDTATLQWLLVQVCRDKKISVENN